MTTIKLDMDDPHYREGDLRLRGEPVYLYPAQYPERRRRTDLADDRVNEIKRRLTWLLETQQRETTLDALIGATRRELADAEAGRAAAVALPA